MFCPQCGSGFREGFTRCNECDVDLVATLPAKPPEPDHNAEYVSVTTVQGQLQLSQIQSFLESNGIPSEVQGESTRNIYGFTVDGLAAAEVLVPRDQAATAIELLREADHGDLVIGSEGAEESE
jgi:putative signal transducing protein